MKANVATRWYRRRPLAPILWDYVPPADGVSVDLQRRGDPHGKLLPDVTWALGGQGNITPNFDKLSEGLLFNRSFANGTHTHQGTFVSLACFPESAKL